MLVLSISIIVSIVFLIVAIISIKDTINEFSESQKESRKQSKALELQEQNIKEALETLKIGDSYINGNYEVTKNGDDDFSFGYAKGVGVISKHKTNLKNACLWLQGRLTS